MWVQRSDFDQFPKMLKISKTAGKLVVAFLEEFLMARKKFGR